MIFRVVIKGKSDQIDKFQAAISSVWLDMIEQDDVDLPEIDFRVTGNIEDIHPIYWKLPDSNE